MRLFLWLVAVLLLLASFAIILFLLKGKPSSFALPKLGLSDLVNVALFLVAVVSLFIAVATYVDARDSARQQQESLDASRRALDSVVQQFTQQQALMEKHLEMSQTQLAVVQEQWKREQENLAKRAHIEIVSLNGTDWETIEKNHYDIVAEVAPQTRLPLTFVMRNTGMIALVRPIYLLTATPANVFLDQRDSPRGRPNHNVLQISGITVSDVLPYSQIETDFLVTIDVTISDEVPKFDLSFKIVGENIDGPWQKTLHVSPVRKQQK